MFPASRTRWLSFAAAALATVGSGGIASAGWTTFQNDTNRVIVVQCTVDCNGQVKRCKPIRLLPGESVREFYSVPSMALEVFDGKNANSSLYSGSLSTKSEKQIYSIGADGRSVQVVPFPIR